MTIQQQNTYIADAKSRRASNRIGCLHHHAFMVKDMEETRHFYEDILGLPLIGTWVERLNPVTNQPDNYVHTFLNWQTAAAWHSSSSSPSSPPCRSRSTSSRTSTRSPITLP